MPAFEYAALDADGRTSRGVLDGPSAKQIRSRLRERGLAPLSVQEIGSGTVPRLLPLARPHLGARERALVLRQLATLIRAGLPLAESLTTIARQSRRQDVKRAILALRAHVVEGGSLAGGMRAAPSAFPETFAATVAAGEQAGKLDDVLERLAQFTEQRSYLLTKILAALAYPALLTLISFAVVVGLLSYVVPQIMGVFEDMGGKLPALTVGLIALSKFLETDGGKVLAVVAILVLATVLLLRSGRIRFELDRLMLALPGIGYLVRSLNSASFTRTLGLLIDSGVPLLESLRIVQGVVGNRAFAAAINEAADKLRGGLTLGEVLQETELFPPVTMQLIASGEAGGNLAGMLGRATIEQERELESLSTALMALLEPLLILVMGGVVLLLVLAILLPVFELNQLIH